MTNWNGMMLLVSEWSLKSPLHNSTIASVLRTRWHAISQVRFRYGLPTYIHSTHSVKSQDILLQLAHLKAVNNYEDYILTYCMVQSPSWEANWFVASQEIPRISRNPKVHYRTHKHPPPVSILGQPNPVQIPTSHLLEIHPNIIHPSTPRSPQWSPSLRFPQQDPMHPSFLTHTRHMPSPSHSSRFYHPHNIGWGVVWDSK